MMYIDAELMDKVAMEIANGEERSDTVSIEAGSGYLSCIYWKDADITVDENGTTDVRFAWCNIYNLEYHDDEDMVHDVECDIEALETMVADYMNS